MHLCTYPCKRLAILLCCSAFAFLCLSTPLRAAEIQVRTITEQLERDEPEAGNGGQDA